MDSTRVGQLERVLARAGPLTAREIARLLDVSPATVSRTVRAAGDCVCRMGRGRSACYGLRRRVNGLAYRVPIARIAEDGTVTSAGTLSPLADGSHWIDDGTGDGRRYEGTPPFVADMRPQGYLGSAFPHWHPDLDLPQRLDHWHIDHELIALARRGEDMIGDLLVGDESLERLWRERDEGLEVVEDGDYPHMARHVTERPRGSSAGGEGPKFLAYSATRSAHVLVKFTAGTGDPADMRWRDLLAAEAIALDTLADHRVAVPHARVLDAGERRFLEVERFDRVGAYGRRGVLSLAGLDAEFVGRGHDWTRVAATLAEQHRLTRADAQRIAWLDRFGRLIGNTDRHLGNISLYAADSARAEGLSLAPVYDMLPMVFAPTRDGGMLAADFSPRPPQASDLSMQCSAADAAIEFWSRIACAETISSAFRANAEAAVEALTGVCATVERDDGPSQHP